jgi:hypothetical protein
MCVRHEVPMEEGDHSPCPVELLACPEHRDEQQRKINEVAGTLDDSDTDADPEAWTDKSGNGIVGFCLWCNREFYTIDEVWEHSDDDSAAREPFQQFKAAQSASPSMPEKAEPLDDGEP